MAGKPIRTAVVHLKTGDVLLVVAKTEETFENTNFAYTGETDEVHVTGLRSEGLSASTHDQVFSVDARGGALLIAEFARRHVSRKANWGRIIGLTSGGPLGFPTEVSYGAAKSALENYTMSAAFELAKFGITSNIVYPPVTDTVGFCKTDNRKYCTTEIES